MGKLRGLLGLGVLGGAAGAVVGGLWWVGATLLGIGEIAFGSLGWTLALWSGFGASATTSSVNSRGELPRYLERLRATGRGHHAERLAARHPDEV